MRPYSFSVKAEEKIVWELFIHWIDVKGDNHLIGRLVFITKFTESRFVIEYFKDCLADAEKYNFERISGCPTDNGKYTWEYPYSYLPIFVDERMINPNRSDLMFHLGRYGLDIYDRYEFFKRSHGICSDNFLFLSDKEDDTNYWHNMKHGMMLGKPKPE